MNGCSLFHICLSLFQERRNLAEHSRSDDIGDDKEDSDCSDNDEGDKDNLDEDEDA